jgi:hypothetical protein
MDNCFTCEICKKKVSAVNSFHCEECWAIVLCTECVKDNPNLMYKYEKSLILICDNCDLNEFKKAKKLLNLSKSPKNKISSNNI